MVVDRGRDGRRPRRALPDRARQRLPGVPRQPDQGARALAAPSRTGSRDLRGAGARSAPRPPPRARAACREPAGARPRARLHRHPALVQHAGRQAARRCAQLRGRVVLVDFWTYTCINCIRTLPYLTRLGRALPQGRADDRRRPHAGVRVRARRRQRRATRSPQNGLRYPVVQDNEYATWNAYGNQYWPAKYLIDARGQVRYAHFGEGDYGKTEPAIRALLAEAGRRARSARRRAHARRPLAGRRDARDLPRLRALRSASTAPLRPGVADYGARRRARRRCTSRSTARGTSRARRRRRCAARASHARLARAGVPRAGLEDGRPHAGARAARREADSRRRRRRATCTAARLTVSQQRLYRLVTLPEGGGPHADPRARARASGYAFTFG